MAAKDEIDVRMIAHDLTQRRAEEFAIIAVEQCAAAAGDDRGAIHSQSELIRMQREILSEFEAAAMWNLDNVAKSQPFEIAQHPQSTNFRDNDRGLWIE